MAQAGPVRLYVAPDGNDSFGGSIPKTSGSNGPLRTLAAAQARARELAAGGARVSVEIEPGRYELSSPLVFGTEDSGGRGGPVTYEAAERSHEPVISGMRRISGWKADANGWWHAHLDEVAHGKWYFSQLFVNGQRRFRPRLPSTGYYRIAERLEPSAAAGDKGYDRFGYRPGDLDPNWHDLADVEVLAIHTWSMARNRISSIDEKTHVVTFTGPSSAKQEWAAYPAGNRYLVENVREALGTAGQWYLDRASGDLTYLPMPGETPSSVDVEAPAAEALLVVKGTDAKTGYVHDLSFSHLRFEGTNWNTPAKGHDFPQAEADLGAAITFENARKCGLEHCTVAHLGTYAVAFGPGCHYDSVSSCSIYDMGAGGVKIGPMGFEHDPDVATGSIRVENCRMVGGGRMSPAAVGVWIGQSASNLVRNNEIRDFYYTGISDGWSWGYAPDGAHDNLIEFNEISDIGQSVLSDMGGIYTLGVQPGTVLRGNVIHDVNCFAYGGWGIYPDEGSSNELIERNLVYRCKSAGFHQHYGQDNVVQNNVFAFGGDAQIMRTRAEDHLSFRFERNIVVWSTGSLLGGNWSGNGFAFDYNLYWKYTPGAFDFAGKSFADWQASGQDKHSTVVDPLFRDASGGDFRLGAGSPALGLGFVPLDPGLAGPRAPEAPPAAPAVPRAFPG